MPDPDAMIGHVKRWKAETIDAWRARRTRTGEIYREASRTIDTRNMLRCND
jgi:hypothetical protein